MNVYRFSNSIVLIVNLGTSELFKRVRQQFFLIDLGP